MTTLTLVLLCAAPFAGLFPFLSWSRSRREAQAMRDFAALLDGGRVTAGDGHRGARAVGRWKGADASVRFLGRLNPPVFLTAVTASRRPSPFAALLVPRPDGAPRRELPELVPAWVAKLDGVYDAGCAPEELFRVVMDEDIATSLAGLGDTEVEILQTHVTIQRREILSDAARLIPLLDAAAQLAHRLDALHERIAGATEEEHARRTAEVAKFLNGFR